MSRSSAVALALLVAGCVGGRRVDLDWHTPAECAEMVDGGCPLAGVRSIRTELQRVDGTTEYAGCQTAPAGLCTLADLQDFLLVARAAPSQGVEIFMTGWSELDCDEPAPGQPRGDLALSCETIGVGVVDLESTDRVAMWCDCPYLTTP